MPKTYFSFPFSPDSKRVPLSNLRVTLRNQYPVSKNAVIFYFFLIIPTKITQTRLIFKINLYNNEELSKVDILGGEIEYLTLRS